MKIIRPDWSRTDLTYGDILYPAMKATDPVDAQEYFNEYVNYLTTVHGTPKENAIHIVKSNIGYFAGYYDVERMHEIHRLFGTEHPLFGERSPSVDEAFEAGKTLAEYPEKVLIEFLGYNKEVRKVHRATKTEEGFVRVHCNCAKPFEPEERWYNIVRATTVTERQLCGNCFRIKNRPLVKVYAGTDRVFV